MKFSVALILSLATAATIGVPAESDNDKPIYPKIKQFIQKWGSREVEVGKNNFASFIEGCNQLNTTDRTEFLSFRLNQSSRIFYFKNDNSIDEYLQNIDINDCNVLGKIIAAIDQIYKVVDVQSLSIEIVDLEILKGLQEYFIFDEYRLIIIAYKMGNPEAMQLLNDLEQQDSQENWRLGIESVLRYELKYGKNSQVQKQLILHLFELLNDDVRLVVMSNVFERQVLNDSYDESLEEMMESLNKDSAKRDLVHEILRLLGFEDKGDFLKIVEKNLRERYSKDYRPPLEALAMLQGVPKREAIALDLMRNAAARGDIESLENLLSKAEFKIDVTLLVIFAYKNSLVAKNLLKERNTDELRFGLNELLLYADLVNLHNKSRQTPEQKRYILELFQMLDVSQKMKVLESMRADYLNIDDALEMMKLLGFTIDRNIKIQVDYGLLRPRLEQLAMKYGLPDIELVIMELIKNAAFREDKESLNYLLFHARKKFGVTLYNQYDFNMYAELGFNSKQRTEEKVTAFRTYLDKMNQTQNWEEASSLDWKLPTE